MMHWTSVSAALPPAGQRVIVTDGESTGEAYIVTVGGVSAWHRSHNTPWEAWARGPVTAWMPLPAPPDRQKTGNR